MIADAKAVLMLSIDGTLYRLTVPTNGGAVFGLTKLGATASYRAGPDGCDCHGYRRHRHCRHMTALHEVGLLVSVPA